MRLLKHLCIYEFMSYIMKITYCELVSFITNSLYLETRYVYLCLSINMNVWKYDKDGLTVFLIEVFGANVDQRMG